MKNIESMAVTGVADIFWTTQTAATKFLNKQQPPPPRYLQWSVYHHPYRQDSSTKNATAKRRRQPTQMSSDLGQCSLCLEAALPISHY